MERFVQLSFLSLTYINLKLHCTVRKACSHLFGGVNIRLAVQTAYPPPLQGLVVSRLQRGLSFEGGTVAGL